MLLLVDGHRVNDPNYNQALLGEEFTEVAELYNIQRIEVIRGPGSAVWGTKSLLAVINVITRKGSETNATEVRSDIGTHSREKFFLASGYALENGIEYNLSSSYMSDQGENSVHFPSSLGGNDFDLPDQFTGNTSLSLDYKDSYIRGAWGRRKTHIAYGLFGTTPLDGSTSYSDTYSRFEAGIDRAIDQTSASHPFARAHLDRESFDGYPATEDASDEYPQTGRALLLGLSLKL